MRKIKVRIIDFLFLIFINLASFFVWLYCCFGALNNEGIVYLHFNFFNEMVLEFYMFITIIIITIIIGVRNLKWEH